MNSVTFWRLFGLTAILFGALSGSAAGSVQSVPRPVRSGPADSAKVYTYVERMPQLPGYGGSGAAVAAAIRDRLSAAGAGGCGESRVFVTFVVTAAGAVTDARLLKGVGGRCDEATLTAVRQLPTFTPGQLHGRPVAVSYTVLVSMRSPAKKRSTSTLVSADSGRK
ncbi:energy transducer TonB [Hymenobacter siberiensis]|jgi:protein TonB|uniref:energy transducer TonB n=1 Tax=Hymenobacter siberiensis TaxID=2848396 RepID=UPI001C1DDBA3|nr:energy transducer TonB [Hymenobacter siberiensis]MBU6120685.1 energy transducer TonB [Hymenobacter siberiensis]